MYVIILLELAFVFHEMNDGNMLYVYALFTKYTFSIIEMFSQNHMGYLWRTQILSTKSDSILDMYINLITEDISVL